MNGVEVTGNNVGVSLYATTLTILTMVSPGMGLPRIHSSTSDLLMVDTLQELGVSFYPPSIEKKNTLIEQEINTNRRS